MKRNKLSIKWNIFAYLIVFTLILLVILWFFQIVFLDRFYETIKTNNVKSAAQEVASHIDKDDLDETIETLNNENYISVRIVGENKENIYNERQMPDSLVNRLDKEGINYFYTTSVKNGGRTLKIVPKDMKIHGLDNIEKSRIPPEKNIQSIVYTEIVKRADGTSAMIMLNSTISPVNTTVETIRVQLIYISIMLIILSIILALFMSRKISKPIIKINNSAKSMAKGNYSTLFEGTGYLEIEELNKTLNYTIKELSKVENLRRELISNISHDLRTPLTMITGYGEVIRDIPGENTPENIQIIIDEAKYLTNLVRDILDISQIEAGDNKIELTKFNLTKSIKCILERYRALTKLDGYKIEFNYDKDIFVYADEMKISQVIYNLINNAITYVGEDKIIDVNQKFNDNMVTIEVVDNGEGIEEEFLPHIWDRYYRNNGVHKRASVGSGLGLSIVKGVLDMHNAKYGVISNKGIGSTFWFQLEGIL